MREATLILPQGPGTWLQHARWEETGQRTEAKRVEVRKLILGERRHAADSDAPSHRQNS